jgi:peptidoglycan hydrolase-like protein with peptidoglycan-binding domain
MTTASPMIQIPLALGSQLASYSLSGLSWCVAHMMRSPVASAGLILAGAGLAMATTNALYLQTERHPAPMFVSATAPNQSGLPSTAPAPVEPVVVTPPVQQMAQPATTQSTPPATQTAPQPAPEPVRNVGNEEVAELQQKLMEMGLFDGTVDGFYGPKTADAIRAFEERAGLPRTGAASAQVLEAVRAAPLTLSAAPEPQPMPEPVAAEPVAQVAEGPSIDSLIADSDSQPMVIQAAAPLLVEDKEPEQPRIGVRENSPISALFAFAGGNRGDEPAPSVPAARDRELVSTIQRGLAKLGFLQGPVDGVAGETTARAIRNFEVFHGYAPSGAVRPEVVDMLVAAGAEL